MKVSKLHSWQVDTAQASEIQERLAGQVSRSSEVDTPRFIAKSIVNSPDDVVVTEETDEEGIVLKLEVADEDKGRVIGKQGRIAQAIRALIRVKAAKSGTKATLQIV